MSPRIKPVIAFSIIIFLVIVIGGAFKLISRDGDIVEKDIPTPRACTEEAMLCPDGKTSVGRTGPNCEFTACPEIVGIADKIIISSPKTDEIVSSPVVVSGKARGSWFFEGSFPVGIYDSNDKLMGQAPVNFVQQSENDTWMTEDFVDFQGRIEFSQPATDSGYMLFKKDNPSDNPELDESFKLPIKFGQDADIDNWQTYRNERYGFEFRYPGKLENYGDYLLEIIDYGDEIYDDVSKIKTHSLNLEIADAPAEGFKVHISITSDSNILNYLKEEINRSFKINIVNNDKYVAFSREGMGDPKGYIIQHDSRYYILEVTFDDGVFEKIISTFKFIN